MYIYIYICMYIYIYINSYMWAEKHGSCGACVRRMGALFEI